MWEDQAIYRYSREQAIKDGVLVDVTKMAQEIGFKFPVAVTQGVWDLIQPTPKLKRQGQSKEGRLWDLLWVLLLGCKNGEITEQTPNFQVKILTGTGLKFFDFWAHCAPGDNMEPVITIMLPGED